MAKKDLVSKKIEDFNEVFADIYNTLLFQEQLLVPERLISGSTESIYKTDQRDLNSQSRDILKQYQDDAHLVISSFGIENQVSIDENMPVRIMGYDAGTYRQQIQEEKAVHTPVITIVLNMTEQRWNKAKSIHEMLDMDSRLAEYVQDYKVHVFDIAYLEDDTIESFTSDFREIAQFFKKKRMGEDPLASRNELKHPREIMEFISVFTQDRRYLESVQYIEKVKREGGAVTMCAVADALITEGMARGRQEGMLEGILKGKIELLQEMEYSIAEIAEKLKISEEKVREVLQQ